MTKDEKGLWSYKTAVLPSDLYSYSFNVDGVKCTADSTELPAGRQVYADLKF